MPVVLTGLYFVARDTSTFAVRSVSVSGGTPALQAQVQKALAPILGTSLLALDGRSLERRVDALPTVLSMRYDRAFPHTLRVTIAPELPVAVVHRGKETWLVSGRGRTIEQIPPGTQLALPRIWVPTATPITPGGFLEADQGGTAAKALALAAGFPARFSTVSFSHDELTMDLRLGVQLRMGEPVDVRLKLAIARRALHLLPAGTTYLDVSLPQRPVAGSNPQVSSTASALSG